MRTSSKSTNWWAEYSAEKLIECKTELARLQEVLRLAKEKGEKTFVIEFDIERQESWIRHYSPKRKQNK